MKRNLKFDLSPKVIGLLGEQLIHDKKIALSELIKNGYDADASKVEVKITEDEIIITDDGHGMDIGIVKNFWLIPGISSKKGPDNERKQTPKYKRFPIGEKGVGRLGCQKLGDEIEITSKSKDSKEVHFKIDWRKINKASKIEDLPPVEVEENEKSKLFKKKTGTQIIIRQLSGQWDDTDKEELSKQLTSLVSPFSPKDDFNIQLHFKGDTKDIHAQVIKSMRFYQKNALYRFQVTFDSEGIKSFDYKFTPWDTLNKLKPRKITLKDAPKDVKNQFDTLSDNIKKFKKRFSINYEDLGQVLFEGYIYDLDNILLNNQFTPKNKQLIKDFIKNYGRIRVYRDGLRVFNYGEKGSDILELDLKRVNDPTDTISSNKIVARIEVDRSNSLELIEKTDREGFVHNDAFHYLQGSLERVMRTVNALWLADREKIKEIYLTKEEAKVSVEKKIDYLKQLVDNSGLENQVKKKIRGGLDSFQDDFEQMKNTFLQSSTTGLNLTFVVHELDKVIANMEKSIKAKNLTKLAEEFNSLQTTVRSYKTTIRLEKKDKQHSVTEIIEQAISSFEFRFESHKIQVIKNIDPKLKIKCKKNLIVGAVNNIFDNSIYWLGNYNIEKRKIIIKAYQDKEYVSLVIADNGKGFNIPFDLALKAFMTGRSDDSSMGIGLNLASAILETHKGFIEEGSPKDERLPGEFKDGAVIKMRFPKIKE